MREFTNPPLASAPPVGGLADVVFDHAQEDPLRAAFGRKDENEQWRDVTAAEFRDEVLALAKGLLAQGIRFGDRVAIMSRTRYEWTLFDYALWTIGAHVVPMYSTSSAEQVFWMLHDAQVSAAVVEHEDHAMTIATVIDRLPQLHKLWQLDSGAVQELYEAGTGIDDEVVHRHRRAVTPESIATIIYTSGTTGRPKGCVISHANFMAEASTVIGLMEPIFTSKRDNGASTLLFLPLAHVFGRMVQVAGVLGKVKLGHQPQMHAAVLLPDLAAFQPTFILAVPYIFEKVFNAARRKAEKDGSPEPSRRPWRSRSATRTRSRRRRGGSAPGRRRACGCSTSSSTRSSTPRCAPPWVAGSDTRSRAAPRWTVGSGCSSCGAGIQIYEGYGLTETTAAAVVTPPERTRYGTVGQAIPGTTVHIADDGEIWLHGDNIFQGYLNDPKATDAALHDGWLATGDLGTLDEDGFLTITGRKKEILVTSGGKSVSPGVLEERVRDHPLVAQCIVVGNDRPYIAALVTLDSEAVDHWLQMRGKTRLSPADLVRDPDLETEVRRAVVAANTLVSQAESIRTFRILANQFTEEHGLLTPSLKLKRKAIENAYATEVEALYRA